jgi:predicted methyltransferase
MLQMTDLAHRCVRPSLTPGAWVVDATAGNGHDTVFLAQCVGTTGRVFAFDVQADAVRATTQRVVGLPQVTLIHAGHEELQARLPAEAKGRLAVVMFNLGYLPGAARAITTKIETTLAALDQALAMVCAGGLVTLVLYPGHPACHPAGLDEAVAVRGAAERLPPAFAVTMTERLNTRRAAPQLLIIQRLR